MAEAWSEILWPIVPSAKLEDAYLRAAQDKGNGYALGAPDLVQGYRAVCDSERAAPQMPQDKNLLTGNVCPRCFGTGWEQFREDGYANVRKCNHVVDDGTDNDVDKW